MIRPIALAFLALTASTSVAGQVSVADGATRPESLTVNPSGDIIVGSSAAPVIHVIRKGSQVTDTFVDLTSEGGTFLGVLADPKNQTLWACHLTSGPEGRRSNLRGFDLATGAQRLRWELPGTAVCNDFSVGRDNALFIADTSGKIYRLAAGAEAGVLLAEGGVLSGVDGITFLNGDLFVNNVFTDKFYRIPLDAEGKAATPVELVLDTPVSRPDGMRSANGKLFVAEGGGGRILSLTVSGDTAHAEVLKEGLQQPTAVEPAASALWFNELRTGKVWSVPLPD